MPTMDQRAQQQRAALLAGDEAVAGRLINLYAAVDRDLQERLKRLCDLIEAKREKGEPVSFAWLQREKRYEELLAQVDQETKRLAVITGEETQRAARSARAAGKDDARELITLATAEPETTVSPTFNRMNTRAAEALASGIPPGAPLDKLISTIHEEMPKEAVARAKEVLFIGVTTGQGPRVVAANFRAATGESLTRSLTIARTETLRAYRTAAVQTYQESSVVVAWIWTASLTRRTCPACLAMHNTVHDKEEFFPAHVRCRCCPRPLVRNRPVRGQSGEEWFAAQDQKTQDHILGKAAGASYRKGDVTLRDFVGHRDHPEYGKSVSVRSLKDAQAAVAKTRSAKMPPVDTGSGAGSGDIKRLKRVVEDVHEAVGDAIRLPGKEALPSRWKGTVSIDGPMDVLTHSAALDFEGHMSFSNETAAARLPRINAAIHESLHGYSAGMNSTFYALFEDYEESVVEKVTRIIRADVLRAIDEDDTADFSHLDTRSAYNGIVAEREAERTQTGKSEREFYLELLHTPLYARQGTIEAWIAQAKQKQSNP